MAPAVVFLHGFTHTGRSWDPVVTALGERYTAIAPDIRGHGDETDARPVTLEAVVADIGALVPGRYTLVGYSMGGRIALHVAFADPERVERLVLIGASPGLADRDERARRRAEDEALADEIERSKIDEFATRWAGTPVLAGLPPQIAAATHADRLRSTPTGLARALRGLGTGALPPLWDHLGELAAPVNLIVGGRDHKFQAIAAQMAARIPHARRDVIADIGHAVHLEAPAAVASTITDTRR
jgi:2-succinyl-6-hydroxy-2,4-cyclohexadiene-1-carboxylate synthase